MRHYHVYWSDDDGATYTRSAFAYRSGSSASGAAHRWRRELAPWLFLVLSCWGDKCILTWRYT